MPPCNVPGPSAFARSLTNWGLMSKKLNVVKRPHTGVLPLLLLPVLTFGSAACWTRAAKVERVEVPVEKVALCPLPEPPKPEPIAAVVCVAEAEPGGEKEWVCLSPEATWALDRWLAALHRWIELAGACPGVVVGPSGVTEELGKLK